MDDGIEFSGWKIKHNIERLSGRTMCRLPEAVSLEEEICSGAHKPISPNPCFLQIGRNVFCETGAGSQTVMDWIGGAAWLLWSCSAHQVQECNSGAGGAGVEEGGASWHVAHVLETTTLQLHQHDPPRQAWSTSRGSSAVTLTVGDSLSLVHNEHKQHQKSPLGVRDNLASHIIQWRWRWNTPKKRTIFACSQWTEVGEHQWASWLSAGPSRCLSAALSRWRDNRQALEHHQHQHQHQHHHQRKHRYLHQHQQHCQHQHQQLFGREIFHLYWEQE